MPAELRELTICRRTQDDLNFRANKTTPGDQQPPVRLYSIHVPYWCGFCLGVCVCVCVCVSADRVTCVSIALFAICSACLSNSEKLQEPVW
jgi:hypothetical protein